MPTFDTVIRLVALSEDSDNTSTDHTNTTTRDKQQENFFRKQSSCFSEGELSRNKNTIEQEPVLGRCCIGSASQIITFFNDRVATLLSSSLDIHVESGIQKCACSSWIELQIDMRDDIDFFEHFTIRSQQSLIKDFLRVVASLRIDLHVLMSEVLPSVLLPNLGEALGQNRYLKSLFVIDFQSRSLHSSTRLFQVTSTILKNTQSLTHLQLIEDHTSWSNVDNEELEELLKALAANNSLVSLDLSHNNLTTGVLERLGEALSVHTNLKHIKLQDCNILGRELNVISEYLLKVQGLVDLDLSWNGPFNVIDDNTTALSQFGCILSKHTTLESIHLAHCDIAGNDLVLFSNHIPKFKTLKELDISDNSYIDETVLLKLQNAISQSDTLENLRLCNYQILHANNVNNNKGNKGDSRRLFASIDYYLKLNGFGVKSFVKDLPPRNLLPFALEKFSQDPDILYYCLTQMSHSI